MNLGCVQCYSESLGWTLCCIEYQKTDFRNILELKMFEIFCFKLLFNV